jgi:hypothetical protein
MDELLSMDVLVASGWNQQTLGISPFIAGLAIIYLAKNLYYKINFLK